MKRIEELRDTPHLIVRESAWDGGNGYIEFGKLRGSVIWSTGAGWEHVSVSPYKRNYMPTWDDMCRLKDMFFHGNEIVIQFHPPKDQYVNNMENCLHLWRCTCTEQPIPPSIMVGIRDGQSRSDARKEAEALSRIVDAQEEKIRMIDAFLAEENINPKWKAMMQEYRQMIADGKRRAGITHISTREIIESLTKRLYGKAFDDLTQDECEDLRKRVDKLFTKEDASNEGSL